MLRGIKQETHKMFQAYAVNKTRKYTIVGMSKIATLMHCDMIDMGKMVTSVKQQIAARQILLFF